MGRISSALVVQAVGPFAWLFLGAMALPAAAQEPGPAAAAVATVADVVSVEDAVEPPVQPLDLSTWSGRTEVYPFSQVILESIFGQPDPDTWRPLPLSTFFSEGWHEPWVPSPSGSGGAPAGLDQCRGRQPVPAVVLHVRTGVQSGPEGQRLPRFLHALHAVEPSPGPDHQHPLRAPQQCRHRLAHHRPQQSDGEPTTKSHTGFGDISFTPRVLLHETKDFSLTTELAVSTPTGTQPLAGKTTTLTPAVSVLEQLRRPLGDPGRARCRDPDQWQWG